MMDNIADTHSPDYASVATLYGAWPADLYDRSLLRGQEKKVNAGYNRAKYSQNKGGTTITCHSTSCMHSCTY